MTDAQKRFCDEYLMQQEHIRLLILIVKKMKQQEQMEVDC